MTLSVCAIFDKKTGLIENPFAISHTAEAVRQWHIAIKNPESKFAKYPEDFELLHVAEFDSRLGQFSPITPHKHLASGIL